MSLPDDVLDEILFQLLKYLWHKPLPLVQARVSLCLVCTRWDSIITHSPRYWSTICLILGHIEYPIPPREVVRRWITLSQKMPLSISIFVHYSDELVIDILKDYLTIFVPSLPRWVHFSLKVRSVAIHEDIVPLLEEFPFDHAIQLQSASVCLGLISHPFTSTLRKIGRLPSLRSLDCGGCCKQKAKIIYDHFNLAALTSLSLQGGSIRLFIDIIRSAVSLQHLKVHTFLGCKGPDILENNPIVLPQLEFLSLDTDYRILRVLSAPRLKILAISTRFHSLQGRSELHPVLSEYLSTAAPSFLRALILLTSPTPDYFTDLLTHPIVANTTVLQIIHDIPPFVIPQYDAIWKDSGNIKGMPNSIVERVRFERDPRWSRSGISETFVMGWVGRSELEAFESTPSRVMDIDVGCPFDDYGDRWMRAILNQ